MFSLAIRRTFVPGLAMACFAGLAAFAPPAPAQTAPGTAVGGNWGATVTPAPKQEPPAGPGEPPAARPEASASPQQSAPPQGEDGRASVLLTEEQTALIHRLSGYFNSMVHLEGRFIQTNPNNTVSTGKFYVQRPGRLRFDYAAPSRLRIVADGRYLSIEDHDLKTVDQYPLESTPFRLLLQPQVDLLADAVIVGLQETDTAVTIALEDKEAATAGRLQLTFTRPDLTLTEWVITDPQGLDTRIQLADLRAGREVGANFFKSSAIDFQKFSE